MQSCCGQHEAVARGDKVSWNNGNEPGNLFRALRVPSSLHDLQIPCVCRQQMAVSKSALIHEIAQVKRELEQHKLQSKAERCDANTSVQKLQEQTSEVADVVRRLELNQQARLHCPVPPHAQGLTGHAHYNFISQNPRTETQHPAPGHLQHSGGGGAQLHSSTLLSTINQELIRLHRETCTGLPNLADA